MKIPGSALGTELIKLTRFEQVVETQALPRRGIDLELSAGDED
jgi:hypothetical protein